MDKDLLEEVFLNKFNDLALLAQASTNDIEALKITDAMFALVEVNQQSLIKYPKLRQEMREIMLLSRSEGTLKTELGKLYLRFFHRYKHMLLNGALGNSGRRGKTPNRFIPDD